MFPHADALLAHRKIIDMQPAMKATRKLFTFLLALLLSMSLLSADAMAMVVCNQTTGAVTSGELFDPGIVSFSPTICDAPAMNTIFSDISCRFFNILNSTFSQFFCALQVGLRDIVTIIITIYITLFGIRILMGTESATSGTIIANLLKVGTVYFIASSDSIGVEMLYNFFIGLTIETVEWVIKAISTAISISTDITCVATFSCAISGGTIKDIFKFFDDALAKLMIGPTGLFSTNAELLSFFISMFVICAPIFWLTFTLMKSAFVGLASAAASFVISIVAIAFLVALSPIFLCFMLFNSTMGLFENWLRFLTSYALQPFLMFAVFYIWIAIVSDFVGFAGQLTNVMTIRNFNNYTGSTVTEKDKRVMFCHLLYTNPATVITGLNPAALLAGTMPTLTVGGPSINCCQTQYGDLTPAMPDTEKLYCITPSTPPPPLADGAVDIMPTDQLIQPSALIQDNRFIYFLAYHLISLLVISYTFMQMLLMAPSIAQSLTHASASLPLGAGFRPSVGGAAGAIGQATNFGRRVIGKPFEVASAKLGKTLDKKFEIKPHSNVGKRADTAGSFKPITASAEEVAAGNAPKSFIEALLQKQKKPKDLSKIYENASKDNSYFNWIGDRNKIK